MKPQHKIKELIKKVGYLKLINIVLIFVIALFLIYTMIAEVSKARGIKENHCLQEESYYYRIQKGLIPDHYIETTKENSDGYTYRCIKWEEKPELGKALVGQKLIYKEGTINPGAPKE